MADPADAERKAELIAALQRSRIAFTHNFQAFRRDVDVPAHLKQSFRRHKTLFLTGAAGVGWVLSRLPARKKNVYLDRGGGHKRVKEVEKMGLVLVTLRFLFSLLRPALAALAAKKISAFVESRDGGGFSARPKGNGGLPGR